MTSLGKGFLACFVMAALVLGCSADYERDLGDGYMFVRTNKYIHAIVRGMDPVVDPDIMGYRSSGHYIFGYRKRPVEFDSSNNVSQKFGYFLLDKSTGIVKEGLSIDQIYDLASSNGIDTQIIKECLIACTQGLE